MNWTHDLPLTPSRAALIPTRQAKRGIVELKFLGPCPTRLDESLRASSDVKTSGTRELTAEAIEFLGFSRGPQSIAAAPAPASVPAATVPTAAETGTVRKRRPGGAASRVRKG